MALPLKKRAYRGPSAMSSKRIRRIERQVYRNRPEMKTQTITVNADAATGGVAIADDAVALIKPCQIGTGTGVNERIGDKIRVYRIEVRGHSDLRLDWCLLQKKTTTDPAIAFFTGQMGAYILDSENTNRFTEWAYFRTKHCVGNGSFGVLRFAKKFPGGTVVKYNGVATTAAVDNEIVIAIINRSGGAFPCNVTCRIWYTDA